MQGAPDHVCLIPRTILYPPALVPRSRFSRFTRAKPNKAAVAVPVVFTTTLLLALGFARTQRPQPKHPYRRAGAKSAARRHPIGSHPRRRKRRSNGFWRAAARPRASSATNGCGSIRNLRRSGAGSVDLSNLANYDFQIKTSDKEYQVSLVLKKPLPLKGPYLETPTSPQQLPPPGRLSSAQGLSTLEGTYAPRAQQQATTATITTFTVRRRDFKVLREVSL